MKTLGIILFTIIGYTIGSIPWALVVGKVFYKIDLREHGSGNLGGTNAGRVLGYIPGVSVIVLDALKALIVMMICNKLNKDAIIFAGAAAAVGHCYPIFADFKGGKAVATTYGFLLGIGLYVINDVVFAFVYPGLVFFMILGLFKYVSLASMVSLLFEACFSFFVFRNNTASVVTLVLALLVVIRHIPNIIKLIKGTESKIKYLK